MNRSDTEHVRIRVWKISGVLRRSYSDFLNVSMSGDKLSNGKEGYKRGMDGEHLGYV